MWAERASKLAVVLVDSGTSGADLAGSDNTGLPLVQLRDIIHKVHVFELTVQWNSSNQDTNGTEESVLLVRCPHFRG